MSKRLCIIKLMEKCIFYLDTRKYLWNKNPVLYQPLPWLGIEISKRNAGTIKRLDMVNDYLNGYKGENNSVLDIGCNVGFFSLSFVEKGYMAYGVDNEEKNLRIASYASKRIKDSQGVFVPIKLLINKENVNYLPNADITFCFSIWHHWVKDYGLREATQILVDIWKRTNILFFDTGEKEMPDDYNLPFGNHEPIKWINEYLEEVCLDGKVIYLGKSEAFAPKNYDEIVERSLFTIVRKGK